MNYLKVKNNFNKEFDGPLLLIPEIFKDDRGFFMESWNKKTFEKIVITPIDFLQDNHSMSKKNVLRGLHYQLPPFDQGKLIRCISGEIFDVILDLRKSSPSFLSWASVCLSSINKHQLWIPSGFAHGFLTLSQNAEIIYKVTSKWSREHERSIIWNDSNLKINWPLDGIFPLLSDKDKKAQNIENLTHQDFFS